MKHCIHCHFNLHLLTFITTFGFDSTIKPWFASIIHSRNMLGIQSTCISKQISRTIGSVVIMWCSATCTDCIVRHCSFIKVKCITDLCLSCRIFAEQVTHSQGFIVFLNTYKLFIGELSMSVNVFLQIL